MHCFQQDRRFTQSTAVAPLVSYRFTTVTMAKGESVDWVSCLIFDESFNPVHLVTG